MNFKYLNKQKFPSWEKFEEFISSLTINKDKAITTIIELAI